MRILVTLLATLIFAAPVSAGSRQAEADSLGWLIGYWHITFDEDGSPPDWTQFRADGKVVTISPQCTTFEGRYHVFEGDIYLTYQLAKGPIALVFRPSKDRKQLTYTSPRTRNNATMEKVSGTPCKNVS